MSEFDLARYQDPTVIQRVLHSARTIAIVGLSSNELRASYFVGYYLKRHGYRIIPVNPRETEILSLIAEGAANGEIAERLYVSLGTVKTHIAEIMHNLGYKVQGSDVADNANVKRLRKLGIPIAVGHDADNLPPFLVGG